MREDKCFPCSRGFGRNSVVYSCTSLGRRRIHSHVKIGGLKYGSTAASFVCEARKNSDFSRQNNRHGSSRGRNRNDDGRDVFENFEEDMLASKNGPLVSHNSGKLQANSSPGPREKEIVELFRKVQARLRERSTVKEEKKVEARVGHVKEQSAVDSLLNLLKKHSVEQGKRSNGEDNVKDLNYDDQSQESNQYNGRQNSKFSDSGAPKGESREANIASSARPRSVFQRKSPVPRVRYQPVSNNLADTNAVPGTEDNNKNIQDQLDLKLDDEPEPKLVSDIDLDTKDETSFPEFSDDDSHDSEQTYNNEGVDEHVVVQNEDLNAMKMSELRALAKSRGVKGFSKMKKGDLVELLTEN